MKLFDMPDDEKVFIDYKDNRLPEAAGILQPVVFYDGNAYCCMLGPRPQEAVYGRGETPHIAITNWDRDLQRRLHNPSQSDELTNYVIQKLQHGGSFMR